jgi:hypothetical protein
MRSQKEWIIAKWYYEYQTWYICGNENLFDDVDFDKINERIIYQREG